FSQHLSFYHITARCLTREDAVIVQLKLKNLPLFFSSSLPHHCVCSKNYYVHSRRQFRVDF
ncbi:unnamed protein product, partial [Prunus brigantina]